MDEPTAALSDHGDRTAVRDDRAAEGRTASPSSTSRIACQEVFALGDRITVLRDGRKIADAAAGRNHAGPARDADGRPAGRHDLYAQPSRPSPARCALEVKSLIRPSGFPTSASDRPRRRNRRPVRAGRLRPHRGRARDLRRRPRDRRRDPAVRQADPAGSTSQPSRARHGLVPGGPQDDRASRWCGRSATTSCWRDCEAVPERAVSSARAALRAARRHHRRAAHRDAVAAPAGRQLLSGGNQQKVVIGKWLNGRARALHLRRADARHRRRRQGRDLPADRRPGARRRRRADDQLRADRDRPGLRSRLCDARADASPASLRHHELTEANIVRLGIHQ